jgi:hypothetical protein
MDFALEELASLIIGYLRHLFVEVHCPDLVLVHFEGVHALLFFQVPKLYNSVDRRRGKLESRVKPLYFDKLIGVSLKSSDALCLLLTDVPHF